MTSTSGDISVRLYYVEANGNWQDSGTTMELSDFAGVLPNIGDQFLEPGVVSGSDRLNYEHRELHTVIARVFNARDFSDGIALVVETRKVEIRERAICP